jgi:hypothetical protein
MMQKRKGKEMELAGRSEQGAVATRPGVEAGEEEKKSAPGVGTAEEEEERVKSRRRIRGRRQRPVKSESDPVADTDNSAPPTQPPVGNQGLPGSANNNGGSMGGVEDGKRLQAEADRRAEDGKIIKLQPSWIADNEMLREEIQRLNKTLEDCNKENRGFKEDIRLREEAYIRDQRIIRTMETQLSNSVKETADSRAETQTERQRVTICQGVIGQLKREVASTTSKLADTTHDKHQLEAAKDEAEVIINGLHERVDALESEVTSHDAVATENTSLQGQIAEVHTSLEDAFSDMAKGLTIEEKFTYLREHQAAAPTGRPRIVSGASLHEETDDVSISDSESHHGAPAPKQTLTFTGITSVETAPIATVKSTKPFQYVDIISVDTVPVSAPAFLPTAAKKSTASLGLSDITTVETAPVIAPAVLSTAAEKSTVSLGFSDITSVETAPTIAPTATAPFTPLLTPTTRRRIFGLSNTTTVETAPAVATPVIPAPRVIQKIKRIYVDKPVDRPVVPWWMWVLFLLGIFACIGGFAGLLREKQIWLDANDLAYERLMGGQQETWMEWIGLGVGDLLPDMGSGMMGHSMFA